MSVFKIRSSIPYESFSSSFWPLFSQINPFEKDETYKTANCNSFLMMNHFCVGSSPFHNANPSEERGSAASSSIVEGINMV